jgi:Ca2+-binding RTX toxin-like protein
MATVNGTNGSNTLLGTNGNDGIFGYGGNDVLKGLGGADYLDGGSGTDLAAYIDSDEGVIVDLVSGEGFGGDAEGDTLVSIEDVQGSDHDDMLVGNNGDNDLTGWAGNDTLKGGGGADTLQGFDGNDLLKGGGGADTLNGGWGIDTAAYNDSPEGVIVTLYDGDAGGGDAAGDNLIGIENVTGSAYDDILAGTESANTLTGLSGDDWLKGFGGADALYGGSGNDDLQGGSGNDTLDGGAGMDTLLGQTGNDTYYVDNAGDSVGENGGEGVDVVRTSVSWVLTAGADVETLRTTNDTGTASINLTGNSSGNVVRGNNGNNIINGGAGDDELTGLGGQDSFLFNTALSAATNVDAIPDFNVATDTILLDNAIFSSSLGPGTIAAGELVIGAAAQDSNDRIVYNSATGALSYDSDGVGGTDAVQFAQLSAGLALTYLDFVVV